MILRKPKIKIDIAKVEEYAFLGLKMDEIADLLNISVSHLHKRRRDSEAIDKAIRKGKAKLKAMLTQRFLAIGRGEPGNVTALIWLDKTRCGTREINEAMIRTQEVATGGEITRETIKQIRRDILMMPDDDISDEGGV